jgi:inner membrane protein
MNGNNIPAAAPTKLMPMPTIITHGFVASLLGKGLAAGRVPPRFWFLSVLCSILPDADVIGFRLGINYEDLLGHRGLSHSLAFAIILSLVVTFLAFPQLPPRSTRLVLFSYFFVVTASHGVLDAMTDGGLGVAFSPRLMTRATFFRSALSRSHPSGFRSSVPADWM